MASENGNKSQGSAGENSNRTIGLILVGLGVVFLISQFVPGRLEVLNHTEEIGGLQGDSRQILEIGHAGQVRASVFRIGNFDDFVFRRCEVGGHHFPV